MTRSYRPVDPADLPDLLAERFHAAPRPGHALRVAIDGPRCALPTALGESVLPHLRTRGHDGISIAANLFWRDASLRLEYGREDVDSYASWLDDDALRREVLDPLGPAGTGTYLPSLRDPQTNRATRAPARRVTEGAVVIVGGELLLGRGLPFDMTIHLAMSPAGRARRTDAEWQWTLPAFDSYDADARPADTADIVIRVDDARHPAMRERS